MKRRRPLPLYADLVGLRNGFHSAAVINRLKTLRYYQFGKTSEMGRT